MVIVLFVYPPTSSSQRYNYMYEFFILWGPVFLYKFLPLPKMSKFFNKHIVFLSISLSQLKVLDKLGSFL